MSPVAPRPGPRQEPPRGVPRWLWPPPGAQVRTVAIVERAESDGRVSYAVRAGEAPEAQHLRALRWLLDEHGRAPLPESGCPFEGEIRLEIARTELPGGRVGFAYAVNGGPLGAPAADGARGILWRYVEAAVGP